MAVSVAQVGDLPYYIDGAKKRTITDVTMDSSYVTGGEPVTLQQLRLSAIEHAEAEFTVAANATDAVGAVQAVVGTNDGLQRVLVKLYDKDVPDEITSGDNLTGCVVRVTAVGY